MLEGNHILLRPINIEDKKDTLALRLDFEANKAYMGFPFPIDESCEERWIQSLYAAGQRRRVDFAIVEKETSVFVGLIGVKDVDHLHQRALFGIILKREFWGKEYAREAMDIFLYYLFNHINVQRVYLEVLEDNDRAKNLYETFGFQCEGVLRKHCFQDGRFKNVVIMGLLREEFDSTILPEKSDSV